MSGVFSAETLAEFARRHGVWVVVALAVAASVSGLTNGFAFDDVAIIPDNERVHSLHEFWRFFGQSYWPPANGLGLYRPVTILAFAIEWAVGGGSPLPFHFVNIVLYTASCVLLYRLINFLAGPGVALLSAVFFAVHPVHTEAVANVVGQAELLVFVFVIGAVGHYVQVRLSRKLNSSDIALISVLYLAGCLSKEHAIVLPGLLLACETLIPDSGEGWRARIKRLTPMFGALLAVAVGFLAIRTLVVGNAVAAGQNELLATASFADRLMTLLNIVIEWLRLLFWPALLSADYSYPRTYVATELSLSMLPGAVVVAALGILAWNKRQDSPLVTFAAIWIAVALVIPSNLFIVTGFVLAERTLFMASAGVCLLLAIVLRGVLKSSVVSESWGYPAITSVVVGIALLGVIRSSVRNPAWRNNETLFRQTTEDVPLSSKAHLMLGQYLASTNRFKEAGDEILIAIALGKKDDPILLGLGADYLQLAGRCQRAVPVYERALAVRPANDQLRINASLCLMTVGRFDEARSTALGAPKRGKLSGELVRIVAQADSLALASRMKSRAGAGS